MLLSLSFIIIISLTVAAIFDRLKFPRMIAFLVSGVLLGPSILNLIDPTIMQNATDLRTIALVVILIRAGLSLKMEDIRQIGLPALLLSFIPATFEMVAIGLIAPLLFDISMIEAFMMGAVIAAVSPAVVVPRMIKLIREKRGTDKKIPQLVLAAASMDDVYVIIIFMSLLKSYQSDLNIFRMILSVPLTILSGLFIGIGIGWLMVHIFKKFHMRDTIKVLILLAISFLMVSIEQVTHDLFPFSGLIAILFMGITIDRLYTRLAERLVLKFEKIWIMSEIMLFVLIGALIDFSVLKNLGPIILVLILSALIFRLLGVYLVSLSVDSNFKEKCFLMISYLPKATVQAAIGAIPLSLGMKSGSLILAAAVISILFTAPIGAILIDFYSKRLLKQQ